MSTPTCNAGYVIPGPTGPAGTNGTNGTNGISAGSITTADFVMPLVASPVTVDVDQHVWMSGGSWVFVQGAGGFLVFGFIGPTQVVLINAGWPGNAAPATNISLGKVIAPSGPMGPTGATGAPGAGGTVLPTTTKGDLPVEQSAGPHPNPARLGVGANFNILTADSTQALGMRWSNIDLTGVATSLSGALPITNGGTSGATRQAAINALAAGADGDILVRSGGNWVSLASPNNTSMYLQGSAVPVWAVPPPVILLNTGQLALDAVIGVLHGLPTRPRVMFPNLIAVNGGEGGYVNGDLVPLQLYTFHAIAGVPTPCPTIYADSTRIYWLPDGLPCLQLAGGGGGPFQVNKTQWRLIIYYGA